VLFAIRRNTADSEEYASVFIVNLPVVIPLAVSSLLILIAIPWAAARGKLHIPGYVGLALITFAVGFLVGRLAGAHRIAGTVAGVAFSVTFFLLIAVGVGCVLAVFFFRHPPES
jgi:hypothetical protein